MNTGTNEINIYLEMYIYTTYLMLVYVCTLLGSICCNICLDEDHCGPGGMLA